MITREALTAREVVGAVKPQLHHPYETDVLHHHHFNSNITHKSRSSWICIACEGKRETQERQIK
jgi:hypothetical protein